MDSLTTAIKQNSLGLAIFAAITAGVIAVTQFSTKQLINENILQSRAKALHEILPQTEYDNALLKHAFLVDSPLLGLDKTAQGFVAMKDGQPVTFFLPVSATEGYTGPISTVVGIKRDGSLAGVRVLQHQETPGLGDKIEVKKDDWILEFAGKSLTNPTDDQWKVKKDGGAFDQFTGATITPRAVVKAIHAALRLFHDNKDTFMAVATFDSTLSEQQLIDSGFKEQDYLLSLSLKPTAVNAKDSQEKINE